MDYHFLIVLAILIVMNCVCGIIKACKAGNFNSRDLRNGMLNKFGYICILCLAYVIEFGSKYLDLGFNIPIGPIVASVIALIEISSIIENVGAFSDIVSNSKIMQVFKTDRSDEK